MSHTIHITQNDLKSNYLVSFLVIFKFVAGVEAHRTLLTPVLLHGMSPEVFVELCLVVEGLVAILALVGLVEVAGKYVGFEVSETNEN